MLLKRVSTAPSLRVAFERLRVVVFKSCSDESLPMHRRELLTAAATVTASAVAGCLGSGRERLGRLDLTVRNDGDEAVDIDVVVRGDDGTLYAEETDRIDPGVARAFEVTVDATGRHEVVVTGGDWEGRLAWDAAGLRPVRRNGRRRRRDRLDCGRVRRHAVACPVQENYLRSPRNLRTRWTSTRNRRSYTSRARRSPSRRTSLRSREYGIDDYEDLIARTTSGIDGEPASGVDWFWDEIVDYLDIDFYTEYDAVRERQRRAAVHRLVPRRRDQRRAQRRRPTRCRRLAEPQPSRADLGGRARRYQGSHVPRTGPTDQPRRQLLESVGIETGDTVGLYMPMVPEVVSILYGCLKVGAIAVPIFSGFGTEATATRIADAEPSVLFTGDGFYRRGARCD